MDNGEILFAVGIEVTQRDRPGKIAHGEAGLVSERPVAPPHQHGDASGGRRDIDEIHHGQVGHTIFVEVTGDEVHRHQADPVS